LSRRTVGDLIEQLKAASGLDWFYVTTGGGCTALQSEPDRDSCGLTFTITYRETESNLNEIDGDWFGPDPYGVIVETDGRWWIGLEAAPVDGDGHEIYSRPLTFPDWASMVESLKL
jgi:hypothetical protein